MTARWTTEATGRTCTNCGVHADAGRIFCASCGATLQTPLPLIRPTLEDYSSARFIRPTKGTVVRSILLGFPLSVVLDIVLGIVIPDHLIRLLSVFIVPFILVGGLLIVFGTVTKNQWGINTKPANCPACGCPVPQVRQPKSIRQALWGGWRCEKCGCEMDKWGRFTSLAR
jgi:hypothetical protein